MRTLAPITVIALLYILADGFRIFFYWDLDQVRPVLLLFSGHGPAFIDYAWAGPSPAFLAYFHDDFFYYLGIAEQFVANGRFTFDGINLTNGFHPLWMFLIIALKAIFSSETQFFLAVYLLSQILCLAGAVGLVRILQSQNLAPSRVFAPALLYFFLGSLISQGMETALVFALFPFFLGFSLELLNRDARPAQVFLWGLLASTLVLSRLDIVIFVGLIGLLISLLRLRIGMRQMTAFLVLAGIGSLPLGLYLGWNLYAFGELMPYCLLYTSQSPRD